MSKDRSTEVLLYLTSQRQISKAIKIGGIDKDTKSVAWVSFGKPPLDFLDMIEIDDSIISENSFDYSTLNLDKSIVDNMSFEEKQKIVMTKTATLSVQPR